MNSKQIKKQDGYSLIATILFLLIVILIIVIIIYIYQNTQLQNKQIIQEQQILNLKENANEPNETSKQENKFSLIYEDKNYKKYESNIILTGTYQAFGKNHTVKPLMLCFIPNSESIYLFSDIDKTNNITEFCFDNTEQAYLKFNISDEYISDPQTAVIEGTATVTISQFSYSKNKDLLHKAVLKDVLSFETTNIKKFPQSNIKTNYSVSYDTFEKPVLTSLSDQTIIPVEFPEDNKENLSGYYAPINSSNDNEVIISTYIINEKEPLIKTLISIYNTKSKNFTNIYNYENNEMQTLRILGLDENKLVLIEEKFDDKSDDSCVSLWLSKSLKYIDIASNEKEISDYEISELKTFEEQRNEQICKIKI